jgi:hypothetical protein
VPREGRQGGAGSSDWIGSAPRVWLFRVGLWLQPRRSGQACYSCWGPWHVRTRRRTRKGHVRS